MNSFFSAFFIRVALVPRAFYYFALYRVFLQHKLIQISFKKTGRVVMILIIYKNYSLTQTLRGYSLV